MSEIKTLAFSVKHNALLILTQAAKSFCCAAACHSDFTLWLDCGDANLPKKNQVVREDQT